MPTVTTLGYICRDRNTMPDGTMRETVGGKGLYTTAALEKAGVTANLITWLPDSDKELLSAFRAYHSHVEVIPVATGTVNTNTHTGDQTLATTQMDTTTIRKEHFSPHMVAMLEQSDVVQISPDLGGKVDPTVFQWIHSTLHKTLSLDAGKFYRLLQDDHTLTPRTWNDPEVYLPYIRWVFISVEDVALLLESGKSLSVVAQEMMDHGVQEVIITQGSKGATVYEPQGAKLAIPAFPPRQLVDPTGAGDTFLGAYLGYRVQQHSPEEAGRFAAMAASALLNYSGPLREDKKEVEALLAQHSADAENRS